MLPKRQPLVSVTYLLFLFFFFFFLLLRKHHLLLLSTKSLANANLPQQSS